MRIKKWLMKQQWRIIQIRGIWSLISGILVLAALYFGYIPFFANMGASGPFAFSGVILVIFLVLGYIYDRTLILWAPSQEVTQERNPYQYVPSPKEHVFWFPLFSTLLNAAEDLADEFGVETEPIQDIREHYAALEKLRPERTDDIEKGIELRKKFLAEYEFKDIVESQNPDDFGIDEES